MLFVNSTDALFGPITTIRQDGCLVKEIPWMAFSLSADDWQRVVDARDILAICNKFLFLKLVLTLLLGLKSSPTVILI